LVMAPLTKWLGIKREDLVKPIKKAREPGDEGGFEEGDLVGDFENEFEGNIQEASEIKPNRAAKRKK
jgi:hypothetical protein